MAATSKKPSNIAPRMLFARFAKNLKKNQIYGTIYVGEAAKNNQAGLCLVRANGKCDPKKGTFEGTCIFDRSIFKYTDEFRTNWGMKRFTHIPVITEKKSKTK